MTGQWGWLVAVVVAWLLAAVATPLMRRIALRTDLMDVPAERKGHVLPTPYLGGVAIMIGVAAGFLAAPGSAPRMLAILAVAVLVGLMGLLDDRRSLRAGDRLLVQAGAACAALALGVAARPTGIDAVDIAVTLLWIVGITNAFNLLDNMDGLAAGVAAVAAVGVFVLGALNGQWIVAGLGASLCAACLGFLAFNLRPADIFMGDAGSLFLGYLIAIAALDLRPPTPRPGSFLVPVILLGVPVLDTTLVSIARPLHGRRVAHGGQDHLSHRLVALGLSRGAAVGVLVATEASFAAVAVLLGRGRLPWPLAALAAAAVAGGLLAVTLRARVYAGGAP